ncbi:thioredoxin fold domain-containing protein [Helicobacter japonicus]|uniref:thioredoxin fold domain-containing protein n=1 Tax=Helicobacter japonicus TaxID=425400 RepID=UPI0025AE5203|nr:thioredoxin fold domain-containing protein [Helicobacter japonicus]
MKILKIYTICGSILIMTFFSACSEESDVGISQGKKLTSQYIQEAEDIDKESYAGLEDVFLDTKTIQGQESKITLLIFGKNRCGYCDKIKDDIKNGDPVIVLIAYYINVSYAKNHLLQFQNTPESTLSTSTLMETYVKSPMRPTPTLIFLTPTGEVIYELPGYIPSNEILALLEYMQSQKWKGKDKDTISLEINESLRNAFMDFMKE